MVVAAEERVVEKNVPNPVVDFLESDLFVGESVAEEDLLREEAEASRVRDASDLAVAGIFRRGDSLRVFSLRGQPPVGRRIVVECFVRSLLVVMFAPFIEPPLLGAQVGPRWSRGVTLQGPMHALVRAILLGARRSDPLMRNP